MKRTEIVYNEIKLQHTIGVLRNEFAQQGYLRVILSTDKPRTLSQNALIYKAYSRIALESGQETERQVRRRCKFDYGLAIAYENDDEALEVLRAMLGPLTREQRMKAMDHIEVSSIMNTDQLSRYYIAIEEHEFHEAREVA